MVIVMNAMNGDTCINEIGKETKSKEYHTQQRKEKKKNIRGSGMSRLTKCKGDYCFMYNCENEEGTIGEECSLYNICYGRKIHDKLCRYEDLEEAGRLIELPCKVGDTVYKLWYKPCHNGEDYPDSYGCCGCEDKCDLERAIFEFTVPSINWILQHLRAFHDNYVWFLTKEEAEKALA